MADRPDWTPDLQATRLEVADGVAWLTLDRPDAANSRNQRMREELLALYDGIARDPDIAVVVLTGAGDRFFSAGMDLKESAGDEALLDRRERLRAGRDIEALARLPRPTIAAINGYALGGGLEMALACDLRVMATEAEVGLPEVGHGLIPGGGATVRLPRLIGPARAFELLYTGARLDGRQAEQLGLVNRAVPRAELHGAVSALAATIARHPRRALVHVKESVLAGFDLSTSAGVDQELDRLLMLMGDRTQRT